MNGIRRHGIALLTLAALAALYVPLAVFEGLGSPHGDGLIYLVTARHYAPYWPADALAAEWAGLTKFPPLYPLVLMVAGGAANLIAAHAVTTGFLLAALVAYYGWLLASGLTPARAAIGMGVFAALPGTFLQAFYLHPEGLYLTLAFGALVLIARGAQTARPGYFWAATGLVALALVTRTVGVTLWAALAIALLRQRPRGWIGMLVAAAAPAVAWAVFHQPPRGYADAFLSHYGPAPGFGAVVERTATYVAATAGGLVSNVVQTPRLHWIVAALGVLALSMTLRRFARGEPDAWYVMANLGLLAIWPYPQDAARLAWVVVPVLLGHFLLAADELVARAPAVSDRLRSTLHRVVPAIPLLIVLPGLIFLIGRAYHPLTTQRAAMRHLPEWYEPWLQAAHWLTELHLATAAGLRSFADRIPDGQCAFSTMPLVAGFYTGHPVVPPPAETVDDGAFEQGLAHAGCRHFILTYDAGLGYRTAHYPLGRMEHRLEIIAEQRIDVGPPDERLAAALAVLRP